MKQDFLSSLGAEPTIIYFGASWCGPCKILAPLLKELEAKVVKVDVDAEPDLAEAFGVKALPILIRIQDGAETARHVGILKLPALQAFSKGTTL